MTRETAAEIDLAAAAWAAKADRGLSHCEQAEFDAWQSGDERRLGAYGRMRAISLQTERAAALGPNFDPSAFTTPPADARPSRRVALLAGGALAASLAGGLIFGAWRMTAGQSYRTRKGEIRQIALADGSVVTLNTASRLEISFSGARRDIRLLEGEAMFDVAHDPQRPFLVTADATVVRAIGTSFTVTHLADRPVEVLVREGVVDVSRSALGATRRVRLVANTRALSPQLAPSTADGGPIVVTALQTDEVHRELAWRDGRIAFEGEPLGAAVAEFARYSDTRIVVGDPALAREEIAGLYQADDPVGFAQAVATSLDAHVEVSSGEVRIVR